MAHHILVNCWIYKFKLKCAVLMAWATDIQCLKRRNCMWAGMRMLQNWAYWIVTKDNWLPFWVIFMLLSNRVWIIFLDRKSNIHPKYLINFLGFFFFVFVFFCNGRRDLVFQFWNLLWTLLSMGRWIVGQWTINYTPMIRNANTLYLWHLYWNIWFCIHTM